MCWCRIRMVLIGLLGLLCVVHVVSGMCGQTFTDPQSSALLAEVVLEGKVKLLSDPDKNRMFNATISVRKTIYKGEEALRLKGKTVKKLTVGKFQAKADPKNCIGALRLGSSYIFFLKNTGVSNGLYSELSAMPVKRSKKRSRLVRKVLCPDCAQAPRIKKLTGQDMVEFGKRAMLKCSAKATPPPSFTWYRNGVLVKQRKGLMIKSGKRQSRLKIKKVGKADVGVYTCEVTNAVGKDRKNFTLEVKVKSELLCETQTFCLNGGTCLYHPVLQAQYCACSARWSGRRCQLLDGISIRGYYNHQASLIYERTLIIVGLVIAVIFLVAIFIASYILAKGRRKRFEAKRRRKEVRRAKEKEQSQPYVTADKFTPYREEENVRRPKANQYGPPPGSGRFPYENDNGFDFYKQQTQPLLTEHQPPPDTTDRPCPESRRRLVASSVYDNTGEPATIWPSSVQGLTRAEVLSTPEAIEMDRMPSDRPSKDVEEPNNPLSNSPQRQPLRSSPPLPQHDPSASQLPHIINGITNQQTAPILPVSQHEIISSPEHLHNSHPVVQCSSNDSDNAADTPVNPPSSSLWNDDPEENRQECGDPSTKNDEIFPVSANILESPMANNSQEADQQLSDDPGSVSPPSYQAAVSLLRQPLAMMLSTDTDSEEDNREQEVVQKPVNGMPEDLHISEEELNLSSENLVSNSFNSLSTSSRQVSVDGDSQNTASVTPPEPWPPRIRKHQSDDIHNGHLWKNPLFPTESFRSQSLDTPGPVSSEEGPRKKHHNHLSSTVANSQDLHIQPNATGRCNHVDNSFDPSDDSPPWDADASREPEYMNNMNEEDDRLNRLKDVCPDQPAIPI